MPSRARAPIRSTTPERVGSGQGSPGTARSTWEVLGGITVYGLFRNLVTRLRGVREHGATAVEYALLVALIAAVIIAIVFALGQTVSGAFNTVNDAL